MKVVFLYPFDDLGVGHLVRGFDYDVGVHSASLCESIPKSP